MNLEKPLFPQTLTEHAKAARSGNVAAPGASQPISVGSSAWFDAFWENWVRTKDVFDETYQAQGTKFHEGYANAIYDLLQDLKRTVENGLISRAAEGERGKHK